MLRHEPIERVIDGGGKDVHLFLEQVPPSRASFFVGEIAEVGNLNGLFESRRILVSVPELDGKQQPLLAVWVISSQLLLTLHHQGQFTPAPLTAEVERREHRHHDSRGRDFGVENAGPLGSDSNSSIVEDGKTLDPVGSQAHPELGKKDSLHPRRRLAFVPVTDENVILVGHCSGPCYVRERGTKRDGSWSLGP